MHAFTLVELLIVVAVIAAVAGLVVSMTTGLATSNAQHDSTINRMDHVRSSIWSNDAGRPSGYAADMRIVPRKITDLLVQGTQASYDFERRRGWRGPYLSSSVGRFEADLDASFAPYGALHAPAPLDGFGNPIVVQIPDAANDGVFDENEFHHARLVSAGPDGILQTPRTDAETTLPGNALLPHHGDCGDDIVMYLRAADLRLESP